MEVEYTKSLVPSIERVEETLLIFKHNEKMIPILKDQYGRVISLQDWRYRGYEVTSMDAYERYLLEFWIEQDNQPNEIEETA